MNKQQVNQSNFKKGGFNTTPTQYQQKGQFGFNQQKKPGFTNMSSQNDKFYTTK